MGRGLRGGLWVVGGGSASDRQVKCMIEGDSAHGAGIATLFPRGKGG